MNANSNIRSNVRFDHNMETSKVIFDYENSQPNQNDVKPKIKSGCKTMKPRHIIYDGKKLAGLKTLKPEASESVEKIDIANSGNPLIFEKIKPSEVFANDTNEELSKSNIDLSDSSFLPNANSTLTKDSKMMGQSNVEIKDSYGK